MITMLICFSCVSKFGQIARSVPFSVAEHTFHCSRLARTKTSLLAAHLLPLPATSTTTAVQVHGQPVAPLAERPPNHRTNSTYVLFWTWP